MRAEIITIGDELLIGQVVDTNSAWMAERLNEIGIELYQITSVHDQREHIVGGELDGFLSHFHHVEFRRIDFDSAKTYIALEFGPPIVAASLQVLDGLCIQVVFALEGLDDGFVVERDAQFGGEFLAHGATAAAQFAVDGNDEFFFGVHNYCVNCYFVPVYIRQMPALKALWVTCLKPQKPIRPIHLSGPGKR